jgi:hypothetical protein
MFILPIAAVFAIAASIFGSSVIFNYSDRMVFDTVVFGDKSELEGFRYDNSGNEVAGDNATGNTAGDGDNSIEEIIESHTLPYNEKLFILANAFSARTAPQSDYAATLRGGGSLRQSGSQPSSLLGSLPDVSNLASGVPAGLQDNLLGGGSLQQGRQYTLHSNTRSQTVDDNELLKILSNELDELSNRGLIPKLDWGLTPGDYEISHYLAVDQETPQTGIPVVYIEFRDTLRLMSRKNVLTDCYFDAEANKICSLSIRSDYTWDRYDPDQIFIEWSRYLGLSSQETEGSSSEYYSYDSAISSGAPPTFRDASYSKSYIAEAPSGDNGSAVTRGTVVTIGFYEGVNEFFIQLRNNQ